MNGSRFTTLLFYVFVEWYIETFLIILPYIVHAIWGVNDGVLIFLSIHSRSCIFSSILFLFNW